MNRRGFVGRVLAALGFGQVLGGTGYPNPAVPQRATRSPAPPVTSGYVNVDSSDGLSAISFTTTATTSSTPMWIDLR